MKLGMSSAQTRFFHVVLLICLSGLSGCYGEKPDELTDCLDHAIDNKVSFIREKDRTIEEAKRMLRADSLSAEHEYDINLKLYEEYRKYILDSSSGISKSLANSNPLEKYINRCCNWRRYTLSPAGISTPRRF